MLVKINVNIIKIKRNVLLVVLVLLGGGISLIPHPATKIIGSLLQIPDIYYDIEDNINNPSDKINYLHTILDLGSQFRHIIPGNIDDILFQLPGIIDDGYTATTGKDIFRKDNSKHKSLED